MTARAGTSGPDGTLAARYGRAHDAYLHADYDACVAMLHDRRSIKRDFLLARAYLRMRRHADAESVLRSSRGKRRSTWAALMGAARARQGDSLTAQALLGDALGRAKTDEERAEARYQQALLHWMNGQPDAAEAIITGGEFGSQSGLVEELRGWIAVGRAEYALAVRSFERAAMLAGGDVMLECNALWTASTYAREMYMPAVMSRVLHRAGQLEWTPHLQVHRYHITRAAAWFAAIEGEYAHAMRQFCSLASFDVDASWRLYALCDRAYLSLALGEDVNGWAIADDALALAGEIDWESFEGGERVALLYVANIFALRRPIDAQRCWRRYTSLPPAGAFLRAWATEPHVEAWEAFTAGSLEKGAGNAAAAAAHFNRAFSIYRRIGFEWRAVLTLVAAGWSASNERGYADYVETTLRRYPNSWLRELVGREIRRGPKAIADAAAGF